jgi:hypothetical protein
MKTFKYTNNQIHVIEDEFKHLLPSGCIEITQEEADAIHLANNPPPTIEQIRAMIKPLSPAQVRLVLNQYGLLTTVESAIASGSQELKIEWEFRTEFKRDNALLNSMATTLGMTDVQLDEMFAAGILL